jgi:quinol monooxygenase YgiN
MELRSWLNAGECTVSRGKDMSITVNLFYKGSNGSARAFADEMEARGIADAIRAEEGNERYEYFIPLKDPETVLLIDSWKDQESLDRHHASAMMSELAELREKYDLHMSVERYVSDEEGVPDRDQTFIRK